MLVSKSFLVTGETIHRNGKPEKNIALRVDEAINSFLSKLDGRLVDLKPNVQIGTTTDTAFITVIVEVDDSKQVESETETEEVKAKRGRPRKDA
jgi:hypothetical protein